MPLKPPPAKKRFSQNFLVDKNVIGKIVRVAGIEKGDDVIEIGPGQGALTAELLKAGARLIAIELDRDLQALLREKFSSNDGFELIGADALKISFAELSRERGRQFKLVANLPYNITGPILFKLLDERVAFKKMTLMFQKEVALRLSSGPGTKDYGVPSVIAQAFMEIKSEFNVPARLFRPMPKVDSTVVSLKPLERPRVDITDERFFKTVVKASFGQRRKTLLNALKALDVEKEKLAQALEIAGIDPERRGETLDLKEFSALTDALLSRG